MNERLKIEVGKMSGREQSGHEPPDDECDVRWGNLTDACTQFMEEVPPASWDAEDVRLILHVLSNDDEWRSVIEPLVGMPDRTLALARAAVESQEQTAKSQLADVLGCYAGDREAERLLLELAADGDEYVRRIALMSLARLGSSHLPGLVEAAWATGAEYQRMACLFSLFVTQSPVIDDYLKLAEKDGREHLLQAVQRIRLREGGWGLPLSHVRAVPTLSFHSAS
jgi:hypothetical protein